MLTFLHLSDLHFTTADAGTQFDHDEKIREALLADLGKDGRTNFDAILITGDIAYNGRAEEFARAKTWFEVVRTTTNSAPEALFVVPGNHDVNRVTVSKDSSLWELHNSLRKPISRNERVDSLEKKLHDPFDFLAGLAEYRDFSKDYGCSTNPKELAWVQVLDEKHVLEDGTPVRFHGLNSALISDGDDQKANLFLSPAQFHRFNSDPGYVNIVLCHHPHAWLIDGNEANDFLRKQAQVVLCGHEHEVRHYMEGSSFRLFAGAVHPNPREKQWEPCYHVLRLSISTVAKRELKVDLETRVWGEKEKCFKASVLEDDSLRHVQGIELPVWIHPANTITSGSSTSESNEYMTSHKGQVVHDTSSSNDAFAAARRRLIVHFFRLGTLARYQAVMSAGVWDESDDSFDGQARWARVFDRAEKDEKLGALWNAVAAQDSTLASESNPFELHTNAS